MSVRIDTAPAGFADWAGLLALIHRAFAFQHDRIDPPSSLHRLDPVSLATKARMEVLILARDGDTPVGCLFAQPRDPVLYVGKFAVEPQLQGRGIGRQLMQAAQLLASSLALRAIELETRIELVENHATFRAMGFEKTAQKAHEGYARPTSITMRKALPAAR